MVVGILATIGLIINGIGTVLGKTWDVSKQFISWLLGVMPRPLKFFFFLYMILFLVTLIVPKFLGAGFACDSQGDVYKMNFLNIYTKTQYVNNLAQLCAIEPGEEEGTVSVFPSFMDMVSSFVGWFKDIFLTVPAYWDLYHGYVVGNVSGTDNEICDAFRAAVSTNETPTRDFVLQQFGESLEQKDYRQVVHVGCTRDREGEWYQTLKFFNVDLFNFEMWLMIGIMVMLVPFAFKWYNWVHKK